MTGIHLNPRSALAFLYDIAASHVAYVVVFGLVSANAVVTPMIARLHSTGRHENLQKMVRLVAKGILLFTAPIALLVD